MPPPVPLLVIQPDFGQTMLIALVWGALFFMAGMRLIWVGGLAGVENDVIPYGIALGNRAALAGLNIVGLKRRGFSRESIHDLRRAYRALFAPEGTLKERVEDVAIEFAAHAEVQQILDFLREGGDRAICMPRAGKEDSV